MGKLGDLWVRLGLKKNEFTAGLDEAQKETQTFGQKVKGVFSSLITKTAALTAAIAAIGKGLADVVKNVASFERANSELAAVLGTNLEGVKKLSESAKDLGRTSEFTASEVTQLQIALARLGFDTGQIESMQSSVLKFALAMGTDLGSAAEFTGSALRAFGLEAKDTEYLLDVMSKSTTLSALNFSKLQTSIGTVAPIAKTFGLNIQETAAFLGVLANNGFDASSAATALRNILLNLADANGKLARGIGHSARTFPEIIAAFKELQEKGVDVGEVLAMTDRRSASAATALINMADDVDTLKTALDGAEGSLSTMSDTMHDNLIGSVTALKSAWEGLTLAFEESRGPMKWIVDRLTDILNRLTDILETGKVTGWEALLGPVTGGAIAGSKKRRQNAAQAAAGYDGPPQSAVELLRGQKPRETPPLGDTHTEGDIAATEKARKKAYEELQQAAREAAAEVAAINAADRELLENEAEILREFERIHDLQPAQAFDNDMLLAFEKGLQDIAEREREVAKEAQFMQESLDNAQDKINEGLIKMQHNAEDLSKTIQEELIRAIEDGLIGAFDGLADVLGGVTDGGMEQVTKALLEPLADMAIKAGTLIMMSGEAIQALKSALIDFNPAAPIVAGAALIAIGVAAKAGLAAIGNRGSASQVTSYGGQGGPAYAAGTLTSELTVNVVGTIHGSDIVLSSDKTKKGWDR